MAISKFAIIFIIIGADALSQSLCPGASLTSQGSIAWINQRFGLRATNNPTKAAKEPLRNS